MNSREDIREPLLASLFKRAMLCGREPAMTHGSAILRLLSPPPP